MESFIDVQSVLNNNRAASREELPVGFVGIALNHMQ